MCHTLLKVSKEEFLGLIADKDSYYKSYKTTKIKDGKTKVRQIEPSNGPLKDLQKRINKYILAPVVDTLPEYIMGGRSGYSVIKNAKYHLGSKSIILYDVKDFFPSIAEKDVYNIFRYRLGFCPEAANMLAAAVTHELPEIKSHVPQGVPTSTNIAILVLEKTCAEVYKLCQSSDLKFSIWVDDLVVSGNKDDIKKSEYGIGKILDRSKYTINPEKETGIISKGSKVSRKVTGIFINADDNMSPGRKRIRLIRSRLRRTSKENESLKGKINFIGQINPKAGRKYKKIYRDKIIP